MISHELLTSDGIRFQQKRSLKEWNWKNAEKGLPLPHKTKSLMEKTTERKKKSIFQRVLDDKRAIRQCIQKGGDVKKVAEERGIRFATPL